MNKQQAIQIVKETLEAPFAKPHFITFIKNLLNHIEDASFTYQGKYIPDAFAEYVQTLERVGKYSDGDRKIDILIVLLKKETSIERARTMQRNFVAWYLNGSRGGEQKDAALVAFVSPDAADWRFSLVKMEYRFEETAKGRLKIKEEFTPARRWSFLVGAHEKSHTAQSRLVPIMADDQHDPTLAELEEAFNIEKVTKEFFEKYRDLFMCTKDELDRAIAANPQAKADFAAKGIDTVNLAKKLLGQIIFLYYLQKKGWFGVPRDAAWGHGSKQFLRELFEKKHGEYQNFFNDILEPLFYEALRIDRSHAGHYYSRFNCKIPFLNGGLFDPMNNYDWVQTDVLLSNDLFSNTRKTKEGDTGDGILDIFDRYNFTVREDEPFEKEVAIDPELLGKAYEKFNAIRPDNYAEFLVALKSGKKGEESKFNKQYGVYYTPREIVHYMCQQSLINYLHTELSDVGIPQEDIAILIQQGENLREHDARVAHAGRETDTYSYQLPESIRTQAARIDLALANIRVCDPAVGSGAFPVGMMSEIVRARQALAVFTQTTKSAYGFKRECIENSLYGVDIDPGAVEIAKLRLWLSLIVDEDDPQNIKPLPNLDYKIVRGNSLVGFPDNWGSSIEQAIEALIHQHINETNIAKKNELKERIDEKLAFRYGNSMRAFGYQVNFDFKTVFSEVFQMKSGFDIVIGNPPFVDSENMIRKDPQERETIAKIFQTTKGNWDLYIPFWEKSLKLTSPKGTTALITPNKWLSISYGKALRQFSKQYVYHLVDYSRFRAFDEAGVFAIVAFMSKKQQEQVRVTSFVDKNDILFDLAVPILTFNEFDNWGAFLSQNLPLVFHLIENKPKLESICDVEEPFTVSEAYLLSEIIKEKEDVDEKFLRFVNTGTIEPYSTLWGIKPTTYLKKKYKNPVIIEDQMRKNFPRRYLQSKGMKIVISGIRHFECLLDDGELVAGKSTVILRNFRSTVSPKFILGLLNSKLIKFFLRECYGSLSMDGGINFSPSNVSQIPIPSTLGLNSIESIVDCILVAKQSNPLADTSQLEKEIDLLVYDLYNLNKDEILLVEKSS